MKSILEELGNYVPARNPEQFVLARAIQVIASVDNLSKLIESHFDPQSAEELQRRLLNAIKSNDPAKFARKINQIRESRQRPSNEA